jgi:RHS repeat-associated protein
MGQLSAELPGPAYGSSVNKYLQYDVIQKVSGVYSNSGLTTAIVKYVYDELGKRIKKLSYDGSGTLVTTTFYVYGAMGELESVYDQLNGGSVTQKELPVHGSNRMAVFFRGPNAYKYELADNLGNVRAVFIKNAGDISMVIYRDYYPFGGIIPGREYVDADGYRYGYQGQYSEKDPETGWNTFEVRMYDSRTGRWLQCDPESQFASPYMGMGDDPVNGVDPDGGFFVLDDFIFGFIGGFFKPLSPGRSRLQTAYDNGVRLMNQSIQIWSSFVQVDKNKTGAGKALQLASHFTWELPQQLLGVLYGGVENIAGINSIRFHKGATIIQSVLQSEGQGITIGSIISIQNNGQGQMKFSDGSFIPVEEHEFGHYIQSRIFGPLFLPGFAAPSLIRATKWSIVETIVNIFRIKTTSNWIDEDVKEWMNAPFPDEIYNKFYTEKLATRWGILHY